MRLILLVLLTLGFLHSSYCQSLDVQLQTKQKQKSQLELELLALTDQVDSLLLLVDKQILLEVGLPSQNYFEYKGFYLEYSEEHEQALWTMHLLNQNVINSNVGRTNDFRPDLRIATGTADSIDYFTYDQATDKYDGYGYDRGHLVPSADFGWTKAGMSDTYYYSNMSPQRPEFNREIWADLEAFLRSHVIRTGNPLIIVNIPIFGNKNKIEQSINGVTIPTAFAKAVLDLEENKTIAFLMKHEGSEKSLSLHQLSLEELESKTDFDFFNNKKLDKQSVDLPFWFSDFESMINPIEQNSLPAKHFNSLAAPKLVGNNEELWICGTCVSTYQSKSGNLWINIDKKYPNSPVAGFIKKEALPEFGMDVLNSYIDKKICMKGKVTDFGSGPSVTITKSRFIKLYQIKE